MTFLQRTASRRDGALVRLVARWLSTATKPWIEEGSRDPVLDIRPRPRAMERNKSKQQRRLPRTKPAESASIKEAETPLPPTQTKEHPKSKFQLPKTIISMDQIQPDFRSTALGQILLHFGMEGLEFDRFAERNPRAFHASHQEVNDWMESVRSIIKGTRDADICQMLMHFPKLLSIPTTQIDRIVVFLDQKLKVQGKELLHIAVHNPSIFEKGFEAHFMRGSEFLYERFKVSLKDLQRIALEYPRFLTQMQEEHLFKLASLFAARARLGPNQVGRLFKECPQLISQTIFDLHEQLLFLSHYSFLEEDIRQLLMDCPSMLNTKSPAELRHVVNYLEAALSADKSAVKKIISGEASVLKLNTDTQIAPNLAAMKNMGFKRQQAAMMVVRCPKILTLTLNDAQTERKLHFLVEELEKELSSLLIYPKYLTFSLEEHILLRVSFMKSLRRNDYKEWPLMKLLGDTDEEFCTRHVKTVPEKFAAFKQQKSHPSLIKLMSKWAPEQRTVSP